MSIPDKLNVIRQQLRQAKDVSGQARQAFGKVEKGSEHAANLLNSVSNDVFEAGLASNRWAINGAGQRAEERLNEVVIHHDQVTTDLDSLFEADPTIQEALYNAKRGVEGLGLPSNSTWLLRSAIDSAQSQEDYATKATGEIDRNLLGMESELEGVLENAAVVGRQPRHHHRHGGRRQRRESSSWGGQSFRERWQARIYEKRQRARALDETTSKLDNPFREIDRAAERGARHQVEVEDYVNQALRWVDRLEQDYNSTAKSAAKPRLVTPKPVQTPSPTAPLPAWEFPILDTKPAPTPAPAPTPTPEGFFRKPWRGK